jgi:methyl-accepting chemotaxis protein
MDRVLLFGFLEEVELLGSQHIAQVIEEISGEIANQAPTPSSQIAEKSQTNASLHEQQAQAANASSGTNPYHAMLSELSSLLDNSLEHKIKLAQQLDQILSHQQQQVIGNLDKS